MAFNNDYLSRASVGLNTGMVIASGSEPAAPTMFTYRSATDSAATIAGANYFADAVWQLSVNDLLYVSGSDAVEMLVVATIDRAAGTITTVAASLTGVVDTANIADGAVTNAKVNAAAAIDFSKLAVLASTNILVGSAGGVATSRTVTGDVTISNTGVTAIAAGVILDADVNAAAAIAFSKLAALPDAQLLVGSAANVATAVALSGDISIDNTGLSAIVADTVVNADIKTDAAIAFSKLEAMTSGNILVGSAGNVATEVSMSGDASIIASGALTLGAVVNAAKADTYVPEDIQAGMPVLHVFSMAGGATATRTIATQQKITVVDAWVVLKGLGTAGDTIEVKNAGGTAITDAMDINDADQTVSRAGTINDAARVVAAAANLQCTETDGGGADSPACDVYVLCYVTP